MKRFLFDALALGVLALVGGFLFAWSGFYNVAASRGHLAITASFLRFGMTNSVETHAWGIEAPPLDDPALIERAAGHFHTGCAPCHGAPGFPPNPITQTLLPEPPDLVASVPLWQPNHLFWIVKHGLKYASMPAWPARERDDEVWAIVAFLLRLPDMSTGEYRRLAGLEHARPLNEIESDLFAQPFSVASAELFSSDPVSCARCHGAEGKGSEAGGVPRIAGQKPEYLEMTLADYASGARPSGVMGPVAAYLDDEGRQQIARYFASLDAPAAEEPSGVRSIDPAILQLGGALASIGDPSGSIPACEACHGPQGTAAEKDPRYPALAGQHPAYLEQQLRLWRAGNRGGSLGEIMSAAVASMTDEQIRAVSLHYSRLGAD